ncbi:hypothetical protein B0T17DRAFT_512324 [Bombardia bombarda]|uniref:Transmembrane protein n=1 Tax=Bombardia bombarda TaxID=252184 RepID=A0AA39U2Z6_9PEZI|nr:hypothetical protein B0T17DRAFT_512324 [Bombardia bombarda]
MELPRKMASPTPRELRRLASDHDFVLGAHPAPRRLGLWAFIATHLSLPAAFCAGAILIIVAIAYTSTTSKQLLECPTWATDCHKADDWTIDHLGTVQGIITLVFALGLTALAYIALAFCEVAIWPLLCRQLFTFRGLEAYLSTTRGSIMSAPVAFMSAKTFATRVILSCAVAVTLIPFASAPLVGYAYTPTWQSAETKSSYTPGGGISELYTQTDPPTSVMVGVLAEYNSWATDLSTEPLQQCRDWYVDREALSQRGSFSGQAVRLQTSISCRPQRIHQLNRGGLLWNAFTTNMTRPNNTSTEVWVRPYPQLTLWIDNFTFVSTNRTRATLVFAALNGTIEGGTWTPLVISNISGASAVACDIDIEAVDDILTVGNPPPSNTLNQTVLSSINNLQLSTSTPVQTAINELLLWFTAAPLMAGTSVGGTQPMFFNSSETNLPLPYTTSSPERNVWTLEGIETFIRLAVGALAQATSTPSNLNPSTNTTQTLTSTTTTKKLDPSRALLLIFLPLLVVTITAALAGWNAWAYRVEKIPVMRMAGAGELLKSAQTRWLGEQTATDAAKSYLPNELGACRSSMGLIRTGLWG